MKHIIIFALFFAIYNKSSLSQHGSFDTRIKSIEQLKHPHFSKLQLNNREDTITFNLDSIKCKMILSIYDPAQIIINWNNNIIHNYKCSYPIWGHYLETIESTDIDKNGLNDLIIESYPVGASGISANIQNVLCVLFYPDYSAKIFELSSFFGGSELIVDYNNDDYFEYICISRIESTDEIYYMGNLFAFRNKEIINISQEQIDFPFFGKSDSTGITLVDKLPKNVDISDKIKHPTVWKR